MFRKKSKYDVARDQLEESLHELIRQAFEQGEQIRHLIAERAPEVRDRIAGEMPDMDEIRDRVPELMERSVDRLPDGVVEYLPESAKPKEKPQRKRSRLKKFIGIGVVTAAGAAVAAVLMDRGSSGSYQFDAPPVPRTAPTTSTTPVGQTQESANGGDDDAQSQDRPIS